MKIKIKKKNLNQKQKVDEWGDKEEEVIGPVSEEGEYGSSSGMASPLPRSILLCVSKSSVKYFGWPMRRAL